jgi:hypothetical protein
MESTTVHDVIEEEKWREQQHQLIPQPILHFFAKLPMCSGSKWQIGNHGLENGVWHACRGCFEWLTEHRNKQKDTERYISQAEVNMVWKKWHKILNYSISEQELRMFSTRQSTEKISYMPEIQIWVEVIQVAPVVMGKQERKKQGNEESMMWSCLWLRNGR